MAARKAKAAPRARTQPADADAGQARGKDGRDARPLWRGNLRLALVSVPVRLYAAVRAGAHISFHQVHQPSGKRVRYQKVVPGIGPVDTDEIVSGFELPDGCYVLVTPEEIQGLRLETKRTLDLVQFVTQGEIDPIWFDRPCYVVPEDDGAQEACGVLRDALRATGKLGLGQFVMRGREYLAALKPCGSGLLLETLCFADEVRQAAPLFAEVGTAESDPELLDLARELIARKTAPFDPWRFHDHYAAALHELIEAKRKHHAPVTVGEETEGGGAKVIDLVEALRRSVGGTDTRSAGTRSTAPRRPRRAAHRKAG